MTRLATLLFATTWLISATAQTPSRPVRAVTDPGVVTTRQSITPAGIPTIFQGRVYGVAFGADASEVWVLNVSQLYRLNWRSNEVLDQIPLNGTPGLQGVAFDPQTRVAYVSGTSRDRKTRLWRVRPGESPVAAFEGHGAQIAGGLAIAPGKRVAVPLIFDNKLAVQDVGGSSVRLLDTGIAPFGAALNRDGSVAWVTSWGGRRPTEKDLTAPTGLAPGADRVVVDARGIASTGTVTRFDLNGSVAPVHVQVGLHPTGLAWDEDRARLYVANANSDTVSVIDTKSNRLVRTIDLQPFERKVAGIAPSAIAVSRDGARIWVALGGANAVAQVRASDGKIEGLIPTGWYPNALSLSADGKFLAVATLLGAGSAWRDEPSKRFVHAYRGSVHVVEIPGAEQLASYTTAVSENNHLPLAGSSSVPAPARNAAPVPVPARAGEPSLIEHVVYIVKENRTYDQLFGDLPKGNGDPALVMFGEDVTPNQRKLAQDYVLLDNFYATGGNSADGHQWVTQANQVSYTLWPGYAGRSYPFDGTDPIAYSNSGFLWDLALARGKSVRIYGEYVGRMSEPRSSERVGFLKEWEQGADFSNRWNVKAAIEPMNKILASYFPSYTNAIPDVARAQILKKDIAAWNKDGKMPNLVIVQLPSDHTFGTSPGQSSPKAMVADNDLAVGQIIEALSKTQFWKKTAVFIVEDDAQNGVDHVDGHRTVALVVSPYTRRGWVDSTFYSNQSMVKTIELILGLPTLSLFDLIANDMRASFSAEADLTPFTAITPRQSLFELNPPASALRGKARDAAIASAKMRFDVPDAAPTDRLNRILWGAVKGWDKPYPEVRQAVFSPLSLDLDDDEREEAEEKR